MAIEIVDSGQKASLGDISINPSKLKVHIKKIDTEYFTPLGIQNPEKKDIKTEGSIRLVYEISGEDAIRVYISVADKNGDAIFLEGLLSEVVAVGSKPKTTSSDNDNATENKVNYNSIEAYPPTDYLKQGTHLWDWDGFDMERKLDTTRLLGKLTFEVRAYSQDGLTVVTSTYTVKTEPIVPKARWVKALITNQETSEYSDIDPDADPIINIIREIDISFNVNLKDGGTRGLESKDPIIITGSSPLSNSPLPSVPVAYYIPGDWDKVPKEEIVRIGQDPLKTRVTSFEDLVNLALNGVKTYWSRNGTRDNGITVDGMNFIVNTEAINTDKKSPYSLDDIPLIFNTNGDWGRSGNPGCWGGLVSTATKATDSALNLFDIRIQQVTYNIGYLEFSNGWGYWSKIKANNEFKETVAHELGHEVLQTFGGDTYSYRHKESTNLVQQTKKYRTTNAPSTGEQDLMKYYYGSYGQGRIVAAEEDIKGLIWLTGIKLIK